MKVYSIIYDLIPKHLQFIYDEQYSNVYHLTQALKFNK